MRLLVIAAMGGFGIGLFAALPGFAAPSFDCAKASGFADKVICTSSKLSGLDVVMALRYSAIRAALPHAQQQALIQSQRQWVKQRSKCRDEACLQAAYDDRLQYLAAADPVSGGASQPVQQSSAQESAPRDERETVAYASRVGMEVTVTGKSGIGSESAEISFVHTRADAKAECVGYDLDSSDACVDRVMQGVGPLNGAIIANCVTGVFTTVMGGAYAFLRERPFDPSSTDWGPDFEIEDFETHTILDGTSASGYGVAMDNFGTLCPAYAKRASWLQAERFHKADPTRDPDPGPSPVEPLAEGTGSLAPEDFEVDYRKLLGQIVAVEGPVWCVSADQCDVVSRKNEMISVPFATTGLPRDLRRRLILCGPGTNCTAAVIGLVQDELESQLAAGAVALRP